MQIEAGELRLADVVRMHDGEREITRIEKNGEIRVWFRGEEANDEPSRVLLGSESVIIQRPGDLFEAPPPPKTVAEARERIFEHMAALGWTVKRHGFGEVNDYVTDPSDTVRIKLKYQAVALQQRWWDGKGWRWNANTTSWGSIKEFAAKIEERSARLLRIARTRARERHEADAARLEADRADNDTATTTAPEPGKEAEPVIVRYAIDEGVLLCGDTKTHKDVIKSLRSPRWCAACSPARCPSRRA